MKTKEFVRRVEELSDTLIVRESGGYLDIIQYIQSSKVVANVKNKGNYVYFDSSKLVGELEIKLLRIITEYIETPDEERVEEKQYIYRFPFYITDVRSEDVFHIVRCSNREVKLDNSPIRVAKDLYDF